MEPCQATTRDNRPYNCQPTAEVKATANILADQTGVGYAAEHGVKRRRLHATSSELDSLPAVSSISSTPRPAFNHAYTTGDSKHKRGHISLGHDEHQCPIAEPSLPWTAAHNECPVTTHITVTTFQHTEPTSVTHSPAQANNDHSTSEPIALSSELQTVCYGMLRDLEQFQLPDTMSTVDDVRYQDGSILFACGITVRLSRRTTKILESLTNVAGTMIELSCQNTTHNAIISTLPKARLHGAGHTYVLSVVIYGSRDVADDIGDWLASMCLHLQTPASCKLVVPYHNPHKMTDASTVPMMTDQLNTRKVSCQIPKTFDDDALRQLYTTRSFSMSSQPALLRTSLQVHQREALTFMQEREADMASQADKNLYALWKYEVDAFGRTRHVEVLTGQSFVKSPPRCRGGLLADEMGLGKTCTMLALIASDIGTTAVENLADTNDMCLEGKKLTLIVVPLPLLQVWEKQINQHFYPGAIEFFTFYGSLRSNVTSFDRLDVVLTTYDTISGELRRCKTSSTLDSLLLRRRWHRIVLDEAHVIKNKDTYVAKAVNSLVADRKWCITGTPVQNRMSDLFSLLRFLGVYPYNEFRKFDQVFLQP